MVKDYLQPTVNPLALWASVLSIASSSNHQPPTPSDAEPLVELEKGLNPNINPKLYGAEPLVEFEKGWPETVAWFKARPELWEVDK